MLKKLGAPTAIRRPEAEPELKPLDKVRPPQIQEMHSASRKRATAWKTSCPLAVTDTGLRWHRAEDIGACAGVKAPHNWCIMLPLFQRVQPGVYTLMAVSRRRDV